jgi:hypothetical protein
VGLGKAPWGFVPPGSIGVTQSIVGVGPKVGE